MKKSILMMSVLLVSQVTFAGYTRNVLATCDQVIDSNKAAIRQVLEVKPVEVVSYTSNGPDFNLAVETQDYQSGFNLDCDKRPPGLRSKSECRNNEDLITIKHTKASLFSELITEAKYNVNLKQLRLTRVDAGIVNQSIIFDTILQCK